MRKKTEHTPVIVRVERELERDRRTREGAVRRQAHINDMLAVFPAEAGTYDPNTMLCYSPREGHSSCVAGYVGAKTRPASTTEIDNMMKHLRGIGYKNLKVVSRASSHHRKSRRAQTR